MKLRFFLILLTAGPAFVIAGPRTSPNYSILTDTLDSCGLNASSANYQHVGSAGSISGVASNGASTAVVKSGYVAQLEFDTALEVVSAVSRKVHGGSGTFDIDLSLTGPPGVECRTGGAGGNYEVVVTFATPVTVSGLSIMSIDGQASGTQSVSGEQVTVNLAAVANAQTLGITLTNVSNGAVSGDIFVPMGVLIGDTTGNGFVNGGDTLQTRNRAGQATDASNFRSDVNTSGSINSGDTAAVRARAGTALP